MNKLISLLLSGLLVFTGCSHLNTKDDYYLSTLSMSRNNIEGALGRLPRGEGNTFITVMERTYLNLLLGRAAIDRLIKIGHHIDNQIKYKVTRGVKSFFFAETPGGYYASEHEIIWMHYLLCWGYTIKGDSEKARVEAKKASTLLGQNFSNSGNGRFDDAFMRILSSIMWMFVDEWEEAKVDLKRALQLNPKLSWVRKLIKHDSMPDNIILVLGGTGYEAKWNVKTNSFIRGFRNIVFTGNGQKSSMHYVKPSVKKKLSISPDSSKWYKRHIKRNSALSDVIDDTKYVEKFGYSSTKMAGHVTLAVLGGLAIFTLGLGVGGALLYVGLVGESSEIAGLGVGAILVGGTYGYNFTSSNIRDAKYNFKDEMDPAKRYRYVRFLPEYSWLGWSDRNYDSIGFNSEGKSLNLHYSAIKVKKKKIFIAYYSDTK